MRARAGTTIHRAGRSWRVEPGRPILLLDGDIVELDGRSEAIELDGEAEPTARGPRRTGTAALALAAFLGLTSPASAETPAAGAPAQAPESRAKEAQRPAPGAGPTGRIAGRLTLAASRKPAAGITIVAGDEHGGRWSAVTDAQGAFVIEGLKPGKYQVGAIPFRSVASVRERAVQVKAGATATVSLTAQRATVRVRPMAGGKSAPPRPFPSSGNGI